MTKRVRSQVQASEMRLLRKIEGVTLFNKVRSSEIQKSLYIEPLLLRIERSQLRWFGHVSRMPQERLPKQALLAKANGRRPVGRVRGQDQGLENVSSRTYSRPRTSSMTPPLAASYDLGSEGGRAFQWLYPVMLIFVKHWGDNLQIYSNFALLTTSRGWMKLDHYFSCEQIK